jgi:predicted ATPase
MLLVLDNIEHLLGDGAGELVVELLQAARALKLLVTSREVLHLQAEWVYVVSGLPSTDEGGGEGVQLFVQRAQRAHVGFVPSTADLAAITRICQWVEGLPLAIELAAAWVRTLSCAEIAEEIEQNPTGLVGSMRDLPARHRSLRTVFEHSWALLSAQEQAVLMKLAVFRGGFTRAAAAAVAGATLEVLSALVAKSLMRRGAGGRYDLHELVRQDAGERLQRSGAEAATRHAHAAWAVEFARTAQSHQYTPAASAWLDEVEREHHNIREVLRWALEPAAGEAGQLHLAAGLELLGALFEFWFVRGHHHEALAFAEQFLARPEAAACPRERLPVLTQAGYYYYLQDRHAEARAVLDQAIALSQSLGDQAQRARALEHWALVVMAEGDLAPARQALVQSLELWRELKAGFQQAEVLGHLGDIALTQQDFTAAEQLYAQAIDPGGDLPKTVRHPYPPRRLAYLALRRGDCGQAAQWARESLTLNAAIQDWRAMAACLVALASVARTQGQPTRAAQLCGAAEAVLASIGASLLPSDRQEYERTVADLKRTLCATDLAAAWTVGRAFSLGQAVDRALSND